MRWFVALFFAFSIAPHVSANLIVENPSRAHGYFIGDILLQRIKLNAGEDKIIVGEIDAEQRINDYLYRFPLETVSIENQKWLELRYQVINAPVQTEAITLPAMVFESDSGKELNLQPWSFTIASLISSDDGDVSKPIPSLRALDVIDKPNDQLFKLSMAGFLATLALWLLWLVTRHLNDSETLPFAKAMRSIKQIPRGTRDTDSQSWVALHRAFNAVGGKTISTGSLSELFSIAPWLSDHKSEITEFYSASATRFYQQEESETFPVARLCKALQRAEKRQAKQEMIDSHKNTGMAVVVNSAASSSEPGA